MKLDARGAGVSFAVTLAGLALGYWQAAALAGVAGGALARNRPLPSAVAGTAAGWLLFLLVQFTTPGGRVANALGAALGLPGGAPVFVLASLGIAMALAALGALVGGGLRHLFGTAQKSN